MTIQPGNTPHLTYSYGVPEAPNLGQVLLDEGIKMEDKNKSSHYHSDPVSAEMEIIEKYYQAGKAGNMEAWYRFGKFILKTLNKSPTSPYPANDAISALEHAFDKGVKKAGHVLADLYLGGQAGLAKDELKAIEILTRCDDVKSNKRLISIYMKNNESEKVLALTKKLADQGEPDAMFQLGMCYANGDLGVEKDALQARKWLEKYIEIPPKEIRDAKNAKWPKEIYEKHQEDIRRYGYAMTMTEDLNALNRLILEKYFCAYDTLYNIYLILGDKESIAKIAFENPGKFNRDYMDRAAFKFKSPKACIDKVNLHLHANPKDVDALNQAALCYSRIRPNDTWSKEEKCAFWRNYGKLSPYKSYSITGWQMGAELGDTDCKYYLGVHYRLGTPPLRKDPQKAKELWIEAAKEGNALAIEALKDEEIPELQIAAFNTLSRKESEKANTNHDLPIEDVATQDLITSKKSWCNKTVSWIRNNPGKTVSIALGVLAIAGLVAGLVALTIFFPYVMVPIYITVGVAVGVPTAIFIAAMARGVGH